MKNLIYLAFCTLLLMGGCSLKQTTSGDPLTRMLVAQTGQSSILVVDLESTPQVRAVNVPLTSTLPSYTSLRVDSHPWGNVGYVTQGSTKTYWMNLTSGTEISSSSGVITNERLLAPLNNGAYLVAATPQNNMDNGVSSYNTISPNLVNTVEMTDRLIIDITACDDNKTILVANKARQYSSNRVHRHYVTKLVIDQSGRLSQSGHELLFAASDEVSIRKIACAAGAQAGVAMTSNKLISFNIDQNAGFTRVEEVDAVVNGPSDANDPILKAIVFSPDGTQLFARLATIGTVNYPRGWIEKFTFNPSNGEITPTTGWLANAPHTTTQYEEARLSMGPGGDYIYVPEPGESQIRVIRTSDGSEATAITNPQITSPLYISVGRVTCYAPNHTGCN